MIKFVYVASLAIMSFLLFIFSKDKEEVRCKERITGNVEIIKDSLHSYMGIITEDNKILFPSSMSDEVVLVAGQKVTICYTVDSSSINPEKERIPVHIESISYLYQ